MNSYVIEYPDKLLVMDVAVRCHRYVLGFIETQLQRNILDTELVICSHDDPDHMGGVKALAALTQAKIALPQASGAWFQKLINNPTGQFTRTRTSMAELFRARSWAMYLNPERDRAAKAQPKFKGDPSHDVHGKSHKNITPNYRLMNDGLLPGFSDWSVIHTPGHSWDSCCFYHAETGSLLTGDTLLGSSQTNTLVAPSIYAHRKQTQASLDKLRALDIRAVYPGHGGIIKGTHLIPT